MDRLADLPTNDTKSTPAELEIIERLFGTTTPTTKSNTLQSTAKTVAYVSLLFVALANPWLDMLLYKIPYCNNKISVLTLKTIVFAILFFLIYTYL